MYEIIIILAAFGVLALMGVALLRIDFHAPKFLDGCLIGGAFFVAVPLCAAMALGELRAAGLQIAPYRPFEDLETTANILAGLSLVAFLSLVRRGRSRPVLRSDSFRLREGWLFLAVSVALSTSTFFLTGRHAGGHWLHNVSGALSSNAAASVIANFANVYRAAVFGVLCFLVERSLLSRPRAVIVGLSLAMLDMALTFNRITLVYFLIFGVIAYRRYILIFAPVAAFLLPAVSGVSNLWTAFRASALNGGYNLESFSRALEMGQSYNRGFETSANNAVLQTFEAANVLVFNAIVNRFGDDIAPLWGKTFLVRPLAIFVPAAIWPSKPPVFGLFLGASLAGMPRLPLNSTLFGEAYGNFYFLWIPALAIALIIVDKIYDLLSRRSAVYGYCGVLVGFAIWRFDFTFTTASLVGLGSFELARTILGRMKDGRASRAGNVALARAKASGDKNYGNIKNPRGV